MTALERLADFFTRDQAREAGYGPQEIAAAVRSGRWRRVRRDTFVLADPTGAAPTREHEHRLRARAVATKLGPGRVVSHQSAVLLHDLPVWGASLDLVHVTRIGAGTSRSRAGVTTHLNRLADGEDTSVRDTRVTTVARSLVDMACITTFEAAVCSMDAALRLGSTRRDQLDAAAEHVRGLRGAGIARRAVAFADGHSESVGESRLRVAIHELRLPASVLQHEFRSDLGCVVGRVDFWWPSAKVICEFDGLVKYRGSMGEPVEVLIAEKRREDALRALTGATVVRVTWAELADRPRLEKTLRPVLR